MISENDVFLQIQYWGVANENVGTIILTGSRAGGVAAVDMFSDYDIEVYVNSLAPFMHDGWLSQWGDIRLSGRYSLK